MLLSKKQLLTSERHSIHEISQSQFPFHCQEHFHTKFALWNLLNQRIFLSFYPVIGDITTEHVDFQRLFRDAKNTGYAWMSFVCSWRLFKVQANYMNLSKIIVKKEGIYFHLPNKGTKKSGSFTRFVDSEFWMPLFSRVFNLKEAFSPWLMFTIRHFHKIYILSFAEHRAMSTCSACTWDFRSHFFFRPSWI